MLAVGPCCVWVQVKAGMPQDLMAKLLAGASYKYSLELSKGERARSTFGTTACIQHGSPPTHPLQHIPCVMRLALVALPAGAPASLLAPSAKDSASQIVWSSKGKGSTASCLACRHFTAAGALMP